MAGKDKNKSDTFNNPFSGLKGLSVSSEAKTPETKKQTAPEKQPEPASEPSAAPVDSEDLFEQAMGQLGVRRTAQDDVLEKGLPVLSGAGKQAEPGSNPTTVQVPGHTRRSARKIARRMGPPEATLDLHGVAAADVVRKVEWFLENARFHGFRFVRIVTGKGSHSATGPVVKPLVETYLSGPGRHFVAVWTVAPGNQGGDGALLVELQRPDEID